MKTKTKRGAKASAKTATKGKSRRRKVLRIGILGSGANPWTHSHLILGEQALEQAELDFLYLLPAGEPVDKKVEPKPFRWELTRCVARGNPRFRPSRAEIDRDGPSYMADTLRYFRKRHPRAELFLIIGEDRAPSLKTWHEPEVICSLATILCGPRYGCEAIVKDEWLKSVLPENTKFQAIEIEYSATWIRKRLAMGKSVRYMLPSDEIEIIKAHGAFGTAKAASGKSKEV